MADRKYTPKEIETVCVTCCGTFRYCYTNGMRRKHCSSECRDKTKISRRNERHTNSPRCSVAGCNNLVGSRTGAEMCEKHYGRVRRNAPLTSEKVFAYRYKTTIGYISLLDVCHPLAGKNGRVYEHRVVAHAANDGVCPGCYWCSASLSWDAAVIDHLDENKSNNDKHNLVVACTNCNRARGAMLPFLKGMSPVSFAKFVAQAEKYREQQRQADA